MALKLRKNPLKSAPVLPYRVLTEEEKKKIHDFARKLNSKYQDEFWKQTQEEARKVLRTIRDGGFIVGGELEWGNYLDGYGAHSHIYSRNYNGRNIEESCDYNQVIGNVDLWEAWGFHSNPIDIWYQNPELIDDALELRDYLVSSGISFKESTDAHFLRKQISDLEKRREGKLQILKRLEGIK